MYGTTPPTATRTRNILAEVSNVMINSESVEGVSINDSADIEAIDLVIWNYDEAENVGVDIHLYNVKEGYHTWTG